jgi:hypothetical protein
VGKPGKKKWLEGLEPPGIERRIQIAENILPKTGGLEGAKRSIRAMNPRPKGRRPCYVWAAPLHLPVAPCYRGGQGSRRIRLAGDLGLVAEHPGGVAMPEPPRLSSRYEARQEKPDAARPL